ncbi:hypothetical protein J7K43_06955, partial [Candidatus Calescamantes bacterium]|nr:hypothetical protein [Candidatus Calescamantes bacterium]
MALKPKGDKMSARLREMKWLGVMGLVLCLGLPAGFLYGDSIQQVPRAALIYSSHKDPLPPIEDYDEIFHNLGWILEKWENTEVGKLVENLDDYDIVLCGRQYNLANTQPFKKYTDQWLAFMRKGGVIIVAPVMDSPADWINAFGPNFQLTTGGYSGTTPKTIANPEAKLNFGPVSARWAEFKKWSPEWIVTNQTDKGMPVVMYQEVEEGLILVSTAYGAKGKSWSFPVEKDFKVIWDFIVNKREKGMPVKITSLSWGKKSFGENILRVEVKNTTAGSVEILPTITLFRNREKVFATPYKIYKIPPQAREKISLAYSITSAVPNLITLTISSPMGEIYFRSSERVNIEDLEALLERSKEKLIEMGMTLSFLKIIPKDYTSFQWVKGYTNEQLKRLSSLETKIEKWKREIKKIADLGMESTWDKKSKIIHQAIEDVNKLSEQLELLNRRVKTWKNLGFESIEKDMPFVLSIASSLEKVFRDKIWNGLVAHQLKFEMAANEYESAQLIIVPLAKELRGVKITCSDLIGENNKNRIASENIDIRRVGYVLSSDKNWYPDPLLRNKNFDISSNQVVQPIWITVHTPPKTPSGEYKGILTVHTQEPKSSISLPVLVKVWNFEIPKELNLPTDANLRVNALAEFFYGAEGAKDPEKYIPPSIYREYLKFLLRYRITPKPWNIQGEVLACIPYLKWRWERDKLILDFTEYDKNVELILNNGGKVVYAGNLPGWFPSYVNIYFPPMEKYIPLIYEHLKEKGWVDIAYFYGHDEPRGGDVEKVKKEMALAKKLAPGVKRLVPY